MGRLAKYKTEAERYAAKLVRAKTPEYRAVARAGERRYKARHRFRHTGGLRWHGPERRKAKFTPVLVGITQAFQHKYTELRKEHNNKRALESNRTRWHLLREKHNARKRERYKKNPQLQRDKRRRTRARRFNAPGAFTEQQWLMLKELYGNRCLCCGYDEQELKVNGLRLVPDHVKALVEGGPNTIDNIQPLCHGKSGCNNVKGRLYIDYRL